MVRHNGASSLDEESLIKRYFENGYTYKDIWDHAVRRCRLKRLGLKRQGSESSLEEVEAAIQVRCKH